MSYIKLIKQLFSKTEAKAVTIFERQQGKKSGRSIKKVEVVSALALYKINEKMFDEIGKPWDEDFMVIVYYSKKDATIRKEDKTCKKVVRVDVERGNVKVNSKSFTVFKYTNVYRKRQLVRIIERFVVLSVCIKRNKVIPLINSYSKVS